MPTREFDTEIAVKIALLEPTDIAKLRELKDFASLVAAKGVDKGLGILVDRFLDDVLGLRTSDGPPLEGNSLVHGDRDMSLADAAAVVQRLLGLGAASARAELDRTGLADFDQLKMLLGRLCDLVDSVHEERELSDFGWQWSDSNAGWENGLGNSEYDLSLVLRALRSHDADWLPPKDPAGSGIMADFITYWFSLSAVVLGHLAWSDPSLGMARWVNSGMPGDDGVLSGLRRLYGADVAALILNANVPELASSMTGIVPNRRSPRPVAHAPSKALIHNPEIARAVGKSPRWSAMLYGGSDPLHLSDHLASLLLTPSPQRMGSSGGHVAMSASRAHILLPDAYGWYEVLLRSGNRLPVRQDGRSWRVDVTSSPLGYLGEFRRSRETGRWFAGKHSSHMLGN